MRVLSPEPDGVVLPAVCHGWGRPVLHGFWPTGRVSVWSSPPPGPPRPAEAESHVDDDIEGAILEASRALEWIKGHSGWKWPGGKDRLQRTQDERWAWIRFAVEDQTSAAVHTDVVTSAFTYSRDEAKALIAIAAALLTVVDDPL